MLKRLHDKPTIQRVLFEYVTPARNGRVSMAAAFFNAPVQQAQDTFWGGYAGYFQDPDRHLLEIAWNQVWKIEE